MKCLLWVFPMAIISLVGAFGLSSGGEKTFSDKRARMLEDEIRRRGISDHNVLSAMSKVERHRFVPDDVVNSSYEDCPLPIGYGQTISQPYIVAYMTEAVRVGKNDRVLEIGTGSGYQAAVLAEIAKEVFSIEIIEPLATRAKETLDGMGYTNVSIKHADGHEGWIENAPFDVIIITAAPASVPPGLKEQLKIGGRMIVPVGDVYQQLILVTRTQEGFEEKKLLPVRFVPMVGKKK